MQFDRRFLLVVSLSLACALLVAGGFYRLARGGRSRPRAVAEKQVVVASRLLPAGSMLDHASLKLRGMPESLSPAGGFSRVEDLLERPVISAIQADEPVIEARIAVKGSGMGLGPLIPPGMRAISVRVNDVVGVAGFVLPGMRVDILVTGRPPNRGDTETRTVLQNITVLSAGQTFAIDGKNQPIATPVVTLLVSPQDAEALTLSNIEGRIQLVLRNSSDRAMVATVGRRLHDIYGTPPEIPVAAEEAPKVRRVAAAPAVVREVKVLPAVESDQMMVIRGAVKKVEVFPREPATK